jgi:hypothetical protein
MAPIEDDAAHQAALEELTRLRGTAPGTHDGDRLFALIRVVDAYERARWPTDHFLKITTADEQRLISPERLAEALEMDLDDLAHLMRTSPKVVRDCPTSAHVQRELGIILAILTKASNVLLGGPQQITSWFKSRPLATLRNRTAAQLVESGHADAVIKYLDLLENGIFD